MLFTNHNLTTTVTGIPYISDKDIRSAIKNSINYSAIGMYYIPSYFIKIRTDHLATLLNDLDNCFISQGNGEESYIAPISKCENRSSITNYRTMPWSGYLNRISGTISSSI